MVRLRPPRIDGQRPHRSASNVGKSLKTCTHLSSLGMRHIEHKHAICVDHGTEWVVWRQNLPNGAEVGDCGETLGTGVCSLLPSKKRICNFCEGAEFHLTDLQSKDDQGLTIPRALLTVERYGEGRAGQTGVKATSLRSFYHGEA